MRVAYSPVYKYPLLPPGHRFPMEKYDLLPEQLLLDGTLTEDDFFHPVPLEEAQILRTHTAEYWTKLKTGNLSRAEIRAMGFPFHERLIWRSRHIAAGTLQCYDYAVKDGIALNIAGGTHHAFADRGEGFCIFNDNAIACNELLYEGKIAQAMIVDLDVHQGNGTAKIFENEPRVFTLSVHGENNYPLRKEKSDVDIAIADGTDDRQYLRILEDNLPRLMKMVVPDVVFYLSGVDVLSSDKLGRLALSKEGCMARDRFVFELCKASGIPVVVSMAGGYSHNLRDIVEAHANTFRVARRVYF